MVRRYAQPAAPISLAQNPIRWGQYPVGWGYATKSLVQVTRLDYPVSAVSAF